MTDSRFDHSWGLGLDLVAFEQRKSKVLQKTDLPQTPQALLGFAYAKNPGNWCWCMPVFFKGFLQYIYFLHVIFVLFCIYQYFYIVFIHTCMFFKKVCFSYMYLSCQCDTIWSLFGGANIHSLYIYKLCMAVMAFNLQQRETFIDYWRNHRLNRNHDIVHVRTSNMCTT